MMGPKCIPYPPQNGPSILLALGSVFCGSIGDLLLLKKGWTEEQEWCTGNAQSNATFSLQPIFSLAIAPGNGTRHLWTAD